MMKVKKVIRAVLLVAGILFLGKDVCFAGNIKLEKIVVTPSRYENTDSSVGKSVTVIDEAEIRASNAKSIPELLKDEPGIEVKDLLGNGKTATVDVRGFGETAVLNTLVLIDGRRTNQIDLSGTDWAQINIDSVERIEIVRGPQSVLYGDNAVGGVINIITKSGAEKKPEIGLGYKCGTYDYQAFNTSVAGGTDFIDYYSGFTQSSTDGHRVNNALELVDATASITAKPAPYLHIKSEGGYHKDWYGMPSALSPANLNTIGPKGSTSPNDRAKTEDYYLMAGPEASYESDNGKLVFSGDVLIRSRRTASLSYSTSGFTQRNDHIQTFGLTPKMSIENDVLSMVNKFMAGIDYYTNRDAITSVSGPARTEIIIDKRTIGVYATDNVSITPSLSVNGGGRMEWAYFLFDQEETTKMRTKKKPTEFALEGGVNYKYADRSSLYASYSRSYRFPAVDEWFTSDYVYAGTLIPGNGLNTDLLPQTGNHFEVGIKEGLLKYLNINADYFFNYIKHELYFNPINGVNAVYDTTVRHGMELDAHIYPTDDLDLFTRYTYEKAFFVGGQFAGNEIPAVSRDKISCGIDYTFRSSVKISYLANIIGPQRFVSDQANLNPKLKLYATHDLKLSYYKYGFSAYVAIYNMLDDRYSSYGAMYGPLPYYFPSQGRNVTLGVEYKF